MQLPKKITPCPILEANVEIRFETKVPPEAVFGVIFSHFQDDFSKIEKNPILQLPEEVRLQDPNLKYQPYYKLKRDNIIIMIGPRVFNIACTNDYIGWDSYFATIENYLGRVTDTKIINSVTRVGLRYINFFEVDIFDQLKVKIDFNDIPLKEKKTALTTSVYHHKFSNVLKITNNATVGVNNKNLKGSIIDIDYSIDNFKFDVLHKMTELITEAHSEEKKLFFSLLEDDFLKSLNPVYV